MTPRRRSASYTRAPSPTRTSTKFAALGTCASPSAREQVLRQAAEEGAPGRAAKDRSGRVVRVPEEDEPGARCDGRGDRLEVVREVAQRDHPAATPCGLHDETIDDEGLVRHDGLV